MGGGNIKEVKQCGLTAANYCGNRRKKKIKLSSATSPWLQGPKEKIAGCRNDDLNK